MKKKLVWIILGVVLVLGIAQMVVLGVLGGIGPLGFIKENKIKNAPGNAEQYHLEHVEPLAGSPLAEKQLLFLGSSVTYGDASLGTSMADYIAKLDSCTAIKEAVSGTTLAGTKKSTYTSRLLQLDTELQLDAVICQLSTNDATMKKTLGQVSGSTALVDFDRDTVIGAMEYIIAYSRETWDCPVIFYTGTKYDNAQYSQMVEALLQLKDKWDITVIDLWNDPEMNSVSQENYALYMYDSIHPTQAGYLEWWTPKFQECLYEVIGQ